MEFDAWLDQAPKISESDVQSRSARAFINYVTKHAEQAVQVIELRQNDDGTYVVIDLETGRPQKSHYPFKLVERLAILFCQKDAHPIVWVLRHDFPETPHLLVTPEGLPRAICVDDRHWAEVRLTWTPAELLVRILSWFWRASHNQLHDAMQPIDPIMFGTVATVIADRKLLDKVSKTDLVGIKLNKDVPVYRLTPESERRPDRSDVISLSIVSHQLPEQPMRRMTHAPRNLARLIEMVSQAGGDLETVLVAKLRDWLDHGVNAGYRLNSHFVVLLEVPIQSPTDDQEVIVDRRAFIAFHKAGDIAVYLGVASTADRRHGSVVGYSRNLVRQESDKAALEEVALDPCELQLELDHELATTMSGKSERARRKVVVVGAGAIGSHVLDVLARQGGYEFSIIDDDILLPHNLARHTALERDVGKHKAKIAAERVCGVLHGCTSQAIIADIQTEDPDLRVKIDECLDAADIVIDATASVGAARFLSDHPCKARRASVFFNPAGSAGILLIEPSDRLVRLRDLEARYLAFVAREEALKDHMAPPTGKHTYTGACRAITSRIPESNVMALSGLISHGLDQALDEAVSAIKIWSMSEDGGVRVDMPDTTPIEQFRTQSGWTISVDEGLKSYLLKRRVAHLPNETGGYMTGLVDILHQSIHIVGASQAPSDSQSSPESFTRGRYGVEAELNAVHERSGKQIRYVGEWHSHPDGVGTAPSALDMEQLDWLASLFDMERLPCLMLIVGEENIRVIFVGEEASKVEQFSC
ncbi:ThiF family adenylyltransferase [Thalassospira xiamenensis]|jgi:integrative and conjugative element protein (TIGR02256 family)|uniref:ThiF family adenylyltransferase n=1 Tax=Thalassospira xiamenensis TaxID=220697 RepID=UPI00241E1505|nr:ThiF family adenylyltransferase [Thalassospira xiamenensis]|tara:strand:- start:31652 stop:33928 length:2277 start_codon:yes stop_codon:yes gene_type:complete